MDYNFIRNVLPEGGPWFNLVRVEKDGRPLHKPVQVHATQSQMEGQVWWLTDKARDEPPTNGIFFTPFSFTVDKVPEHLVGPNKSRNPRKHDQYKSSCRVLWLDVDVKEGGHYGTKKEALSAVIGGCSNTMPKPTYIVDTGGGFHFYWVFPEAMSLDTWNKVSARFDQYWKDAGVRFDPISCDSARVLRLPGTDNMKTGEARPCRLVDTYEGLLVPFEYIGLWPKAIPSSEPVPEIESLFPSDGSSDLGDTHAGARYTEEVVKECGVLGAILQDGGSLCSEPLWKNVLQFNRWTEDGTDYNHKMSNGHADFSEEGLIAKVGSLDSTVKPITCAAFREGFTADYPNDPCSQCKHWSNEKIKSPLALGRKPEDKPTYQAGPAYYPRNLVARDGKTFEKIPAKKKDEPDKEVLLCGAEILQVKAVSKMDEEGVDYPAMVVSLSNAGKGTWDATLDLRKLSGRDRNELLIGAGIIYANSEAAARLGNILMNWQSQLHSSGHLDVTYKGEGWKGEDCNAFVIGDKVIDQNGTVMDMPDVKPAMKVKGELSSWQHMAHELLKSNNPAFRIMLAASFAAPLVRLVGLADRMASLSLYSRDSGIGKSTGAKVAASIWYPARTMQKGDDTQAGVMAVVKERPHVPIIWDDPKGEGTRERLLNLLFSVNHGTSKQRADNTGGARDVQELDTFMLVTSNSAFHGELCSQHGDAEAARLMEMLVPSVPLTSPVNTFNASEKEFGIAGVTYMQYVMRNRNKVQLLADKAVENLATHFPGSDERFYRSSVAMMLVAATLASEAGVIDLNKDQLFADLQAVVQKIRVANNQRREATTVEATVREFLASPLSTGGMCDHFPMHGGARSRAKPVCLQVPARFIDSAEGRKIDKWDYVHSVEDNEVRIVVASFKNWYKRLRSERLNEKDFFERAEAEGILTHRPEKKRMACGEHEFPAADGRAVAFGVKIDATSPKHLRSIPVDASESAGS